MASLAPSLVSLAVPLVVLGVVILAWAAVTGPVRLLDPSGRRRAAPPTPTPTSGASGAPPQRNLEQATRDVRRTTDLSWLGDLIAGALLVLLLLLLLWLARTAWRRRGRRPPQPADLDFEVLPDRVERALRAELEDGPDPLVHGSPRNAVVACWLRLEEVLEGAGLPPARAETSTEFVVRALHSLDLDPRATASLAELYREARFSDHPLGEPQREAAREALEALRADLSLRGAVR